MYEHISNKRIAKNTIILYGRSILVMVVALYTSRVILSALGLSDYGLYNVIGGVVGLFTFLRTSMEKCTQRFLNVEMTKEKGKLSDVFRVSFTIHIIIAIFAIIITESIGLWYLNSHIMIPDGRIIAANWVYQSTIIGLCFTILTIPFSATIIAHEKMGFFAFVSIVDAFLNLCIALMIDYVSSDHLIIYSLLVLVVNCINLSMYVFYCMRLFNEVSLKILWKIDYVKKMFSYIGWTLFGHTLIIITNQGNILLINQFYGVIVNAAMAVASQVNRAVLNFTNSFQTAFNPQITKLYAAKNYEKLLMLVYGTTKISYFLLLIISLPLMFNIDFILQIWLKDVPSYTGEFCILMLISGILQATTSPLNFCVMSSEKIKWFQITTGIVFISDLFILYLLFSMNMPAITAMWIKVFIMTIVCFVRLIFASKMVPTITIISYFIYIIIPLSISSVLSVAFSFIIISFVNSVIMHIFSIIAIALVTSIIAYLVGLNANERYTINNHVRNAILAYKNR